MPSILAKAPNTIPKLSATYRHLSIKGENTDTIVKITIVTVARRRVQGNECGGIAARSIVGKVHELDCRKKNKVPIKKKVQRQ